MRDAESTVSRAPSVRSAAASNLSRSSSSMSLGGTSSSGETEEPLGRLAQPSKEGSKAKPETSPTAGGQTASAITQRTNGKGTYVTSAQGPSPSSSESRGHGWGTTSSQEEKGPGPNKKR